MGAQSDLPRFTKKEVENNRKYEEMPAVSMSAFPEGWTFGVIERQKSSTERASSTGSAQCLLFSRRRSYIPAAVSVSIMSSDVFVQQLFPVFQADTTVKTAAVPEVVRRL